MSDMDRSVHKGNFFAAHMTDSVCGNKNSSIVLFFWIYWYIDSNIKLIYEMSSKDVF